MPSSMLKRHIDERVMSQAKGQSIGHTGDWVESQHKKHEQIIKLSLTEESGKYSEKAPRSF